MARPIAPLVRGDPGLVCTNGRRGVSRSSVLRSALTGFLGHRTPSVATQPVLARMRIPPGLGVTERRFCDPTPRAPSPPPPHRRPGPPRRRRRSSASRRSRPRSCACSPSGPAAGSSPRSRPACGDSMRSAHKRDYFVGNSASSIFGGDGFALLVNRLGDGLDELNVTHDRVAGDLPAVRAMDDVVSVLNHARQALPHVCLC